MSQGAKNAIFAALEKFFSTPGKRINVIDNPASFGRETHANWELLFYRQSLRVGFEKLDIIPPGVVHKPLEVGVFTRSVIVQVHYNRLGVTDCSNVRIDFRGSSPLLELLVSDLEQLLKCRTQGIDEKLVRLHLDAFAATLSAALRSFDGKHLVPGTSDNFNYAASYISNNFRRSDLALSEVAAHIGVSPSALARIFRANVGITARAFLIRTRLAVAVEMIRDGSYFLNDIAIKTGWNNYSYFAKMFRRHFGMTPGRFARSFHNGRARSSAEATTRFNLSVFALSGSGK